MPALPRILLTTLLGALGGMCFAYLGLPLPWMLGALFFTMIAAISGVRVKGADPVRPLVFVVIGVMLGARFSPGVMEQAMLWLGSLALLALFLLVIGVIVVPYYRYFGKLDWTTAYFAGMPGGLAEMVEIGTAKGGQVLPMILAHSLRVVLTIVGIAFWFRVVMGHEVGTGARSLSEWPSLYEGALLVGAGVLGLFLGKLLRLPAPYFLGPMLVSAVLHLSDLSHAAPPDLLVIVAQVILGSILGCRFYGMPLRALRQAVPLALGATVISLALAWVFALLIEYFVGPKLEQGILALAPGGLTEMGLLALAIQADVAFVALHHVVRIVFIIAAAPLIFGVVTRLRKTP